MKTTSKTTGAEMQLQAEMDSARLAYEDSLAMVRGEYFRKLELLHNKLAKDQQVAVDRYHDNARAQLSEIIDGLGSVVTDEKTEQVPDRIWYSDAPMKPAASSKFFAPEPDYIPELDTDPVRFDPALLDRVDSASRNPFRRGRHRP